MKGYLDRIEDNKHAVILVEELGKEYIIDVARLPNNSKEGTWFHLEIVNDEIVEITIDEAMKEEMEKKISNIMDKLRNKNKTGSKFRRN